MIQDFIFRGLVLPEKERWVYGDRKIKQVNGEVRHYIIHRENEEEYEICKESEGICTQQEDLDGVSIYSLDIVEFFRPHGTNDRGVVLYNKDLGAFIVDRDGLVETSSDWWSLATKYEPTKVIGNIIHDPDLMNNIVG